MKIQAVKGTRDFFPAEMARRNYIVDGWKNVSIRNGFEEYDGPIFEYLQLYQIKSGDEISEQLFRLTDRGGRDLAIRPEITPTLARMVNEQINTLAKPIKWFSVPRLCRAERPQKGRLREFFQWNIDIIGVDDVLADAEVIFCGLDYLQQAGLGSDDVVVKISSRKMMGAVLESIGISGESRDKLYTLLDKKNKLPADVFAEELSRQIEDGQTRSMVSQLMEVKSIDQIGSIISLSEEAKLAIDELGRLFEMLRQMGVEKFCQFDISIIRGLAYYTGVVFEFYDKAGELRAIGGGGRYDNLLQLLGGPAISATGMGMGDVVLGIVLEEKGLLKSQMLGKKADYYVGYTDAPFVASAVEIAAKLRRKGYCCELSYKPAGVGKILKAASAVNAKKTIILAQEFAEKGELLVKDMHNQTQQSIKPEALEG